MIKRLLLAVLVVVIVACGYLYARLDSLVKKAVETYGPRLTQTTVTLRSVHLSPFSGRGRLKGLVIGSPEGFKEPEVLSLGSASVALEPKSLLSEVIVVHELSFEAPELYYEREKNGVNLDKLQKNVESSLPAPTAASAEEAKPSKPKKIRIEHFSARGGKVFVDVYGVKAQTPLPDVTLDDIGGKDGVEPKEAVHAVLVALKRAAVQAAETSGVGRDVEKGVRKVEKEFKGLKGLFH